MITALLIAFGVFYAFMMFFSLIIAGKGRGSPGDASLMVVFWPIWVTLEARHGDPFLRTASVIFFAFTGFFLIRSLS